MSLKSKLWKPSYAHAVYGGCAAAVLAGFTSAPYPLIGAIGVGLVREILQQFGIPKAHEKQTVLQMFGDVAEFTLGGAVVEIIVGFLK